MYLMSWGENEYELQPDWCLEANNLQVLILGFYSNSTR